MSEDHGDTTLAELVGVLGWSVVAYMAGADSTDAVLHWLSCGEVPPAASRRVQLAHAVVMTVVAAEGDVVARTWFVGLSPVLDDRSPASIIREGVTPGLEATLRWASEHPGS